MPRESFSRRSAWSSSRCHATATTRFAAAPAADDSNLRERPSESRIREAVALPGVDTFVVACPKDVTMYEDAVKTSGNDDRIRVRDVVELVEEALAGERGATAGTTATETANA